MKFKRLTINNIGPVESKTIDFTAAPLGSASLFLISGPTGSGKSIILDAVCLALYGEAARLKKVSQDKYADPLFNCSQDGSITLGDPRQLVRRGTSGALAELVFIGNNGKEYTASWVASRGAKGRLSAQLKTSRSVRSSDGTESYDKIADCNACIASADVVGLQFDEFCRTTLLAQGEFTRFLDCGAKEKAEILEKITGTEKFSKIGEKINEKFKEIQSSAKGLLDSINDPEKQPMSDEERGELEEESARLDEERAKIIADRDMNAKKKQLLMRREDNKANMTKAENNLSKAAQQKSTDGYRSAVRISSDWKASIDVRAALRSRLEAEQMMQDAMDRKTRLRADYASLSGGLLWLKESLGRFSEVERSIAGLSDEIAAVQRDYQNLDPEALGQEGKRLISDKNILDHILNQARRWLSDNRFVIAASTLKMFSPGQSALYEDALSKSEFLWAAETKAAAAKEKYESVFSGFKDHAAAVRSRLKEGDICPVCGNVIRTLLNDESISRILKPYRDELDAALAAADKAKKDCLDVIDSISGKITENGLSMTDWQTRNSAAASLADRISKLQTRLASLQKELAAKASVTESIERISKIKERVKTELGAEEPESPRKVENANLEARWNNLSSGVERCRIDYDNAKDKEAKACAEISAFMESNHGFDEEYLLRLSAMSMAEINELDREIKIMDDLETGAKAQIEACRAELENIGKEISDNGYVFSEYDTAEALSDSINASETEISRIDTRKGEIRKAVEVDERKLANRKRTLEEYEKIRPVLTDYETLNSLFGQSGGALFKKIAQSHLLGILLENANFYLSQFTGRYELMRQEGSLVVLMKDKLQDDIPRPANTLSGGESFMASLALALGLSCFSGSDFSSDTIFIDEGFGTLSPDCLENVYQTLASLKKVTGKRVGIISHVEELKEQIRPQIAVEPAGNGLSRINDPE